MLKAPAQLFTYRTGRLVLLYRVFHKTLGQSLPVIYIFPVCPSEMRYHSIRHHYSCIFSLFTFSLLYAGSRITGKGPARPNNLGR
jgi:hypothetical protein